MQSSGVETSEEITSSEKYWVSAYPSAADTIDRISTAPSNTVRAG